MSKEYGGGGGELHDERMCMRMARVGGLWQSKMATGRQLKFYVSIFTFGVILSGAATAAAAGTGSRKGNVGYGVGIGAQTIIRYSSWQVKPFSQ